MENFAISVVAAGVILTYVKTVIIKERLDKLMADFTAANAAAVKLGADTTTALKNLADHLGKEDPSIQTGIDALTATLNDQDAKVLAADPGPVA